MATYKQSFTSTARNRIAVAALAAAAVVAPAATAVTDTYPSTTVHAAPRDPSPEPSPPATNAPDDQEPQRKAGHPPSGERIVLNHNEVLTRSAHRGEQA